MGVTQKITSCPWYCLHLTHNILPPWRSRSTVTRKLMSTPFEGASGPSGHAGLRPALRQPVRGNHATPVPVLTWLEQAPPEQSISYQIRKLTVRLLVDVFDLRTDKLLGDTSTLLKRYCHTMRYDPVPLTKYPPDRSEGVICDEGKDRRFVGTVRWAGLGSEYLTGHRTPQVRHRNPDRATARWHCRG